jgi:hypothetical protein
MFPLTVMGVPDVQVDVPLETVRSPFTLAVTAFEQLTVWTMLPVLGLKFVSPV